MTWVCIVPTCRPESFVPFLQAWGPLFEKHNVRLVVVQDLDEDDAQICNALEESGIHRKGGLHLFNRSDLPWFIPTGTDQIRSWGIYKAWRTDSEYTITLDDDVRPHGDPFAAYQEVFERGAPVSSYFDVGALTTYDGQLRGYPFKDRVRREVAVQYGGWHGVLDYDAPTQLEGVNAQEWFSPNIIPVPKGVAVTGCIMNAAWRTKYAPILWQLPMLDGRFNRFGDIWAGLFAKRVCDALNVAMVVNGAASVRHERASDPAVNMERERPGIPVNEGLWDALRALDDAPMTDHYAYVTDCAADYFQAFDEEYAEHFWLARDEWLGLFDA